jgi:hypothetical protein
MSKMLRKDWRRPVRLDRAIRGAVFDLEMVHRGFRESLLVGRLFRRPVRFFRGRSRAAR